MSAAGSEQTRTGCRPVVEDKWSLAIVTALDAGPMRFTQLKRALDGVSQRMLTVTLRNLERDGIISRTIHHVMPPHVSYALTPLGVSFLESVTPMLNWGLENVEAVEKARLDHDARVALSAAEPPGPRGAPGSPTAAATERRQ